MCPTGWFIETQEAPDYLDDTLARRPHDRRPQGHCFQIAQRHAACANSCVDELVGDVTRREPSSSQ